ncbi:MAG: TraB/GumN family protein [Chlamydiia bacterium]
MSFRISKRILDHNGHWAGQVFAIKDGRKLTCVSREQLGYRYETDLGEIAHRINKIEIPHLASLQQVQNLGRCIDQLNHGITEHNSQRSTKVLEFLHGYLGELWPLCGRSGPRSEEINPARLEQAQYDLPTDDASLLRMTKHLFGVTAVDYLPPHGEVSEYDQWNNCQQLEWHLNGLAATVSEKPKTPVYAVLAPISSLMANEACVVENGGITTQGRFSPPGSIAFIPASNPLSSCTRDITFGGCGILCSGLHGVGKLLEHKLNQAQTLLKDPHGDLDLMERIDRAQDLIQQVQDQLAGIQVDCDRAEGDLSSATEHLFKAQAGLAKARATFAGEPANPDSSEFMYRQHYSEVYYYLGPLDQAVDRVLAQKRSWRITPPSESHADGVAVIDGKSCSARPIIQALQHAVSEGLFYPRGVLHAALATRKPAPPGRRIDISEMEPGDELLSELDPRANEAVKGFLFEIRKDGQKRGVLLGTCHYVPAECLQFRRAIRDGLSEANMVLSESSHGDVMATEAYARVERAGKKWGFLDLTLRQLALDQGKQKLGLEDTVPFSMPWHLMVDPEEAASLLFAQHDDTYYLEQNAEVYAKGELNGEVEACHQRLLQIVRPECREEFTTAFLTHRNRVHAAGILNQLNDPSKTIFAYIGLSHLFTRFPSCLGVMDRLEADGYELVQI